MEIHYAAVDCQRVSNGRNRPAKVGIIVKDICVAPVTAYVPPIGSVPVFDKHRAAAGNR